MQHLKSFQKKHVPLILKELEDFFREEKKKAKEKDQVLVDSVKVLEEFVLRGGKRIGPLMVILGYRLAQYEKDQQGTHDASSGNLYRAACSVEIHHLYLLNLDDMADRDILRHGGKTLEEYYRTEVFQSWPDRDHHGQTYSSINGALLNSYTFELLTTSGFEPSRLLRAVQIITDLLFSDTLVGWQIHYLENYLPIEEATEEQFLKGLEFVTSRYKFVGPLLLGLSLCSNTESSQSHKLSTFCTQYGKHVGMAFQIYDDIMGLYGDPEKMGKAAGNDVREGKKTLLMQYAYTHGNDEQKQVIKTSLNSALSLDNLKRIQEVVKETGSLKYSQDLAKKHVQEAIKSIEKVKKEFKEAPEELLVLKELAQYMINREK